MRGQPIWWGDQSNQPQGVGNGGEGQPDWGWGATVDMAKKASSKAGDPDWYEVTVLLMCKPEDIVNGKRQRDTMPTPMVGHIRLDRSIGLPLSLCRRLMRVTIVCKGCPSGAFLCCPGEAAVEVHSRYGWSSYPSTLHFFEVLTCKTSVDSQTSVYPFYMTRFGAAFTWPPQKDGEMRVVAFTLESLVELSSVRLLLPPDLRTSEKRAGVAESMKEAVRRYVHTLLSSFNRISHGCVLVTTYLHARTFLFPKEVGSCYLASDDHTAATRLVKTGLKARCQSSNQSLTWEYKTPLWKSCWQERHSLSSVWKACRSTRTKTEKNSCKGSVSIQCSVVGKENALCDDQIRQGDECFNRSLFVIVLQVYCGAEPW